VKKPDAVFLDDLPGGPKPGTLIVELDDLPDHGGKDIQFCEGTRRTQLIVQRFGTDVRVYVNSCPHAGTPLNLFDDRFLDQSGTKFLCRTHGALFEPLSGRCVRGPCKGDYLLPVAFEVRDGSVYSF